MKPSQYAKPSHLRTRLLLALLCVGSGMALSSLASAQNVSTSSVLVGDATAGDTVHVAPPTGQAATDRASVQAAFDAARPGGTVQFAPGTYLLGAGARLTVPDVTVLGHPGGTVLRGCDPEAFEVAESELVRVVFGCTGLYVQAKRQTIRGLTFEYTWHGIVVGPFPTTAEEAAALGPDGPAPYLSGGHRIEGNTFRATPNGLRVLGTGDGVSVVRDNDFVDVFHAIGIYGAPLHFVGNRVTVEDPSRVPFSRHPGSAVLVAPGHTDCSGHVVAGNRIEGYPDPVYVYAESGQTCRGVEVRGNTIRAARVRIPEAWYSYTLSETDSTMIGTPITLLGATPGEGEPGPAGMLEEVVVRGNRIEGAEGLGVLVQDVSNSRIEGNTITGIERRSPFPGITWDGYPQEWEAANGSGIWLSPGSTGNEVTGNVFEDVAAYAVVVEGDSNRVALGDPAHEVRDLGTGNRVRGPGGAAEQADGSVSVRPRVLDGEVPRTPTLPGIKSPAFPYAQPEEVGLSSDKLDRLGDEITAWVANGDLVGAELLIVKDGRAVFHEAYGWSDREHRVPVERGSIWSIKSMSKPFTATAVLMLAEQGRLSLNDPVSRYLPGFAGDERTTIRHLLSHTSGYRNADLGDPVRDVHETFRAWVEDWASRAPSGTFGAYEYTDFGFAAAGYVVEAVTGVPIGPFTEARIAEPLGLADTRTFFTDDPAWRARLNPWYRWNDEAGGYELRWTSGRKAFTGWPFYPAAWGMFSTAMDYATFMAMWMNGGEHEGVRLLEETTVEEALRAHAWIDGEGVYGYGWDVRGAPGEDGMPQMFEHGGGDGTLATALPGEDALVIWLTHSRDGTHRTALMNRLGDLGVFGVDPLLVQVEAHGATPVTPSAEEQARYVGTYRGEGDAANRDPRVWEEDGRLRIRLGRLGQKADFHFDLVPLGEHRFALGRYRDGRPHAVDPVYGIRFVATDEATPDEAVDTVQLLEGDRVLFTARRADPDALSAEVEAMRRRTSIAPIIAATLEEEGIEAARTQHRALLATRPDSILFGQSLLNTLGYRYLTADQIPEAVAVFEMNVEAYPEEPNPYDSLGDAYRTAGRLEEARRSYERAVELAEQEGHEFLEGYRRKLERVTEQLEEQ